MDEIPLSTQFAALALLLVCSAFFSMSETAMMASNRIRLRHMAQEGHRGARLAVALLGKTDQLLGVILLGNTLVNSVAAMLTGALRCGFSVTRNGLLKREPCSLPSACWCFPKSHPRWLARPTPIGWPCGSATS
jgi:CBS domain containing-hemolysin-like protein